MPDITLQSHSSPLCRFNDWTQPFNLLMANVIRLWSENPVHPSPRWLCQMAGSS